MILVTKTSDCVCVCVCVCVFIKLHMTTQSGPAILVITCHSQTLPRGIKGTMIIMGTLYLLVVQFLLNT